MLPRSLFIVVVSLGIISAFPLGCLNTASNPAPSSMVSSETPVENGGISSAAPTLTPPQDPLSDNESVIQEKFAYKLRASYGPRFDVPLDPDDPESRSFSAGTPALIRLFPQWIHITKDGVPYGSWYPTLDGATLRYVWTPSGEGADGAKACDLLLHDTGGTIGTEIMPLFSSGTEVRLPLAAGRLKIYAYDPAWETAPKEMVAPIPAVPSCGEGFGFLPAEDLEKFISRKFVNTGERSVFHLASFNVVPVAEVALPPKSLSTIPALHR